MGRRLRLVCGEPVWADGAMYSKIRRLLLVVEHETGYTETTDLGEADRPSAVAARLRQAASMIEQVVREEAEQEPVHGS